MPKEVLAQQEDFTQKLRLAEEGHAEAQANVARMYLSGYGTGKSNKEAAEKWARTAAGQGNPIGEFTMGEIYFWQLGVPKDTDKSFEWFTKAAEQGVAKAQAYLGLICLLNAVTFRHYLQKPMSMKSSRMGSHYWLLLATRPGLNPWRMKIAQWCSRVFVSSKEAAAIREKISSQNIDL